MYNPVAFRQHMKTEGITRNERALATDETMFGRSFELDFYDVDPALCNDLGFFYDLLIELTDHLGMTRQSQPWIFRSPDRIGDKDFTDKAGLSGWVPLIESGIQIHTVIPTRFVSIDIYTCGAFDPDLTLYLVSERLGSARCEKHLRPRGPRYPFGPDDV